MKHLLINLAQETNGKYFNIDQNNSVISELYNLLSKDESKKTLDDVIQKRKERYQWFLLPGFIFYYCHIIIRKKGSFNFNSIDSKINITIHFFDNIGLFSCNSDINKCQCY